MSGLRNRKSISLVSNFAGLAVMAGCTKHHGPAATGAPPSPNIALAAEPSLFGVDHLEQFPLATDARGTWNLVVGTQWTQIGERRGITKKPRT